MKKHDFKSIGVLLMFAVLTVSCMIAAFTAPVSANSPAVLPLPQDLDRDGLYEDVNANGRLDFADVVMLFENLETISQRGPKVVALYDFNSNERMDFADVVKLYERT